MSAQEPFAVSQSVRDSLTSIHQRTLELIVAGAPLQSVLDALCDAIDALDVSLVATVLLADPDGQRLWPAAGRRAPNEWKRAISPLPIAAGMGSCGTAAFRKERVVTADIATDPLWSGPAEEYRRLALTFGFTTTWSVPLLSKASY